MNMQSANVHPIMGERLARLRRLCSLDAPTVILAMECALVVRAWHEISLWRAGFAFLLDAVKGIWSWRVSRPWFTLLCHTGVYHDRDDEGICFVCSRDRDGKLEEPEEGGCCDAD